MTKPTVQLSIARDHDELSRRAAEIISFEAKRRVHERGRFLLLLSGGETPRLCYELLARKPFRTSVPWHAVEVFWGDERFVPPNDPRNNARMAGEALLEHVPLADSQVHPIPILATPRESAIRYEQMLLRDFAGAPPRFDVTILGLGDNGHTASLFPGNPVLDEDERWVSEVMLSDGQQRITLTVPVLNRSALILFLVSGSNKAQVLKEVLEGRHDPRRLPAQLIHPERGRVIWLVDREASELLELPEGVIDYGANR